MHTKKKFAIIHAVVTSVLLVLVVRYGCIGGVQWVLYRPRKTNMEIINEVHDKYIEKALNFNCPFSYYEEDINKELNKKLDYMYRIQKCTLYEKDEIVKERRRLRREALTDTTGS